MMRKEKYQIPILTRCKFYWAIMASILVMLFAVSAFAFDVTLAWDPNTQPDLAGYTVYQGTASFNYTESVWVGNVVEYQITDLEDGIRYYFAVTASDDMGRESDYSNEISASGGEQGQPPEPAGGCWIKKII